MIHNSTKVILDGLKRNMSLGNSLSDELELSSVLICVVQFWGSYSEPKGSSSPESTDSSSTELLVCDSLYASYELYDTIGTRINRHITYRILAHMETSPRRADPPLRLRACR